MYISKHVDYFFCNPIALSYNIIFKCMKPFILQIISLNHHIYFSNIIITIKTENIQKIVLEIGFIYWPTYYEVISECTIMKGPYPLKNYLTLMNLCFIY